MRPGVVARDAIGSMAVEERTRRVLRLLARRFRTAGITWQLGGSGLLFARGLVDRVGDLDLVFPDSARDGLQRLLADLGGAVPDFASDQEPGFVSGWRCRYRLEGQELDLSGAIALEIEGRVVRLPFAPGPEWDLDGEAIPLAPLEQWLLIYRLHKPGRAALLEEAVDEGSWRALCAGIGIPSDWRRRVR